MVDYSQSRWPEQVLADTGEAGADMVFDGVGGEIGRAAGRIRPVIGQRFPLEQAADAHLAIEARDVIGKTLLVI